MSYIRKPRVSKVGRKPNGLGLTLRDYEGGMSTLCAGCGHDSITAALVQAFFELEIPPHRVAKVSGIGCSSKTPAYFLGSAHGLNSVHGRMPSVVTGAAAANSGLCYIGVSGDGDSLSIGMGQFAHAMRRNLNMVYIIENNGVYGLTKGQFSASADVGSQAKKGEVNEQSPIDPVLAGLAMGGTFIARGFSGDKAQLVPLIKAAVAHEGFALLDILSPCVTFNDHETSTKSYSHTREFSHPATQADFIPPAAPIKAAYEQGEAMPVQMHDGSQIVLRKIDQAYDPTSRSRAFSYLAERRRKGEIVTGLLYIDEGQKTMHEVAGTVERPLTELQFEDLCPGVGALEGILARYS